MKPVINTETAVRVSKQINMLYDGAVLKSEQLGVTVDIVPVIPSPDHDEKWSYRGIRKLEAEGTTGENKMWTVLSNASDWQIANEID